MPEDDKPNIQRFGDVRPDWLTTGAKKPESDATPEESVEAPWEEAKPQPSRRSRIWSLTWVSCVSIVAIASVVYLAVKIGADTPNLPAEEPAKLLTAEERRKAIESRLRNFFEASSTAERTIHVLEPQRVRPALEDYYTKHSPRNITFDHLEELHHVLLNGHPWSWAKFSDTSSATHLVGLKQTAANYKLDWEAFVAYGELPWDALMQERPTTPTQMRVYLSHTSYRNFKYSDPNTYAGYKIEPRDGGPELYGFVNRDTLTHSLLLAVVAPGMRQPVNVRLHFEADAGAKNLVVIDEVIHRQWTAPSISAPEQP